ncbi:MAG: helix-turn-helix domain-containing protein [bacterium]|nr:helix-turn-helix domain-containing protein [bacterium]
MTDRLPGFSDEHAALVCGTLSLGDAAALLGVSIGAARRAAQQGQIPALRFGRRWRILRQPLERLLAGCSLGGDM